MKTTTKTGRKIVGAFVSAAVMFSMIPAMVFADDAPASVDGYVPITVNITEEIGHGQEKTFDGISIYASRGDDGNDSKIKYEDGIVSFKARKTGYDSLYTFMISPTSPYAGGVITGISFTTGAYGSERSGTISFHEDFAGVPDLDKSGDSVDVSFTEGKTEVVIGMNNDSATSLYVPVSNLVVTVMIPVTSVTVTGAPTDPIMAGTDPIALGVEFAPDDTTFSLITWTSSDPTVATVDDEGNVTPVSEGSADITAAIGGMSDTVTIYVTANPDISGSKFRLAITMGVAEVIINEYGDAIPADLLADIVDTLAWARDIYNDPDSTDDDYDYASEVLGDLLNIAFDYIFDGGDDTVYYTEEQLRQMSVNNFVENLYLTILNRQFDAAGRDSWLNCLMQQGGTATEVVIGFLKSPEYTSYNVSNEEFVATCYRVFCNRAATAAETASWVAQLEGGTSRDTVISQFAQSPEWANICAFFKVNV